jgi:hypothetical protein
MAAAAAGEGAAATPPTAPTAADEGPATATGARNGLATTTQQQQQDDDDLAAARKASLLPRLRALAGSKFSEWGEAEWAMVLDFEDACRLSCETQASVGFAAADARARPVEAQHAVCLSLDSLPTQSHHRRRHHPQAAYAAVEQDTSSKDWCVRACWWCVLQALAAPCLTPFARSPPAQTAPLHAGWT